MQQEPFKKARRVLCIGRELRMEVFGTFQSRSLPEALRLPRFLRARSLRVRAGIPTEAGAVVSSVYGPIVVRGCDLMGVRWDAGACQPLETEAARFTLAAMRPRAKRKAFQEG